MIYGTYHSVEPFHRDRYLDETVLRFNTRKMTAARTTGRRITYKELTDKLDSKGAMA